MVKSNCPKLQKLRLFWRSADNDSEAAQQLLKTITKSRAAVDRRDKPVARSKNQLISLKEQTKI
jgi:hypothetical protein